MAKVLCLVLCLALIHAGYALKCYNCVSSPNSKNCDDLNDKDNVPMVQCGKPSSQLFTAACIKKVIEDKNTKMMNTTRACILTKTDGSSDECKPPSDRITVMSCEVCSDDLCNEAAPFSFNFYTILGSISFYFILKHFY